MVNNLDTISLIFLLIYVFFLVFVLVNIFEEGCNSKDERDIEYGNPELNQNSISEIYPVIYHKDSRIDPKRKFQELGDLEIASVILK